MSLNIEALTVHLAGVEVLHNLGLDVATGERFAIMGASGSGKSTLLRTIAGLVRPSSGRVHIDGSDVTDLPTHKRPIGLMFQDNALFPHLTVSGNVAYGLRMAGVDRPVRDAAVADLLDRVGLTGMGDRKPETLSGGEQQRVALARTIAPGPSLVMFDEPLASLDVALRDGLLSHIKSVVDQMGTTSMYVTHDRAEAFSFADKLAVLHDGRIVAAGTPSTMWGEPPSALVARLIGHANVVDGAPLGLGRGLVTIPDRALTIDVDGDLSGTVIDAVFDSGRYRIAIDVGGTILTVSSNHAEPSGRAIFLSIDSEAVVRLPE